MDININNVPTEILQYVFRYLKCDDLITCSRVCSRWKNVVDDLSDLYWKENCAKKFSDIYQDSQRKSGLTWLELFKSLSLWSDVANASINITQLDINENIRSFTVLKNNVISFYSGVEHLKVSHYDLKTKKVIYECLIKTFVANYAEDDKLFVTEYAEKNKTVLDILYKGKSKGKEVRKRLLWKKPLWWLLKNGEVFYEIDKLVVTRIGDSCMQGTISLGRLKIADKNDDMHFEESVISDNIGADLLDIIFKKNEDNDIYILQNFLGSMFVTAISLKNNTSRYVKDFEYYDNVTGVLRDLGFNWSDPKIYWDIRESYPIKSFRSHKLSAPFSYGNYVITQYDDKPNYIFIFANPYNKQGNLKLFKAEPVKTIFLENCVSAKFDVIETSNGPKLIVLTNSKLFTIDFLF